MPDTSWLDDAPDAAWLDDAPDAPVKATGPKPTGLQAFGAGAAQGATVNFGDEIEGAIQALLRKYVERDPEAAQRTFGDVYRSERDYRRKENKAAQEAHGGAYLGGQIVGTLPTAALVPGPSGATLGARALSAAKLGAGYGAATGAGRAEEIADVPRAVATDAAIGAVTGPLAVGATAAVGAGYNALRRKAADVALEQGRKALTGNAGTIAVKKELSPEAVRAAYETGAIRPFSTVKGIAERLGDTREALGQRYGQIIDDLAAAGVRGPNALALGQSLRDEARQIATQSLGSPAPSMYEKIGLELQGLKQGMHGVSPGVPRIDTSTAALGVVDPRLGLVQAENMKRSLQNAAQAEYVKEGATSLSGEAKRELAARLRQAVEDAVDAQASKAPAEAAAFVPVKQRLGAVIEASKAADTAAARAARKSNIGLVPAIAASGGMASGGVGTAALLGTLAKLAQTRGTSTLGWGANQFARLPAASVPTAGSKALSPEVRALLEFLRGRPGVNLSPAIAEGDQ